MRIIGRAAYQPFLDFEAGAEVAVHDGDELADLRHRLRADAVAGKEQELAVCHGDTSGWMWG